MRQSLARDSDASQPKDVYKTGPNIGLYAIESVAGRRCQIIVDTGSNISNVHPDVLKRAGLDVVPTAG